MTQLPKPKRNKWAILLLKVMLAIMALGIYKDYGPLILESSSFIGTVYVYMHLLALCFIISWAFRKLGVKWYREMLFSGITLLLLLLGTETILRFLVKTHLDYCEISGNPYRASYFEQNIQPKDRQYAPFDTVWTSKTEFAYYREINEKGIFEKSIPPKTTGEIRFLCLGGSFTEGVGTEYDSTWVKQTERLLQKNHPNTKITFINAGVNGNDPFGEYHLLTTKLLDYQPDWVIMVTNNSDIFDFIERGGMERYHPDGSISYRKGPWWYQAYRYSYIVRHIAHDIFKLKGFLITEAEEDRLIDEAVIGINNVCQSIDSIGKKNSFEFLLVLQPMFNEVEENDYGFEEFEQLLGCCNRTLNLLPEIKAKVETLPPHTPYYWPLDMHYNALGYQFMAKSISQYIDTVAFPILIDTTQTPTDASPIQP